MKCRPVVPGGAGGAMAPPNFGRSVNPILIKGGRLCPPNNTGTPKFSDLSTALLSREGLGQPIRLAGGLSWWGLHWLGLYWLGLHWPGLHWQGSPGWAM